MRVAFAYRNLNRSGSLERDAVLLLEGLVRLGVELHCDSDPGTSVDVEGVVRRDVHPVTRARSRLGYPLLRGSFAHRATRALRADCEHYDLVHVLGVSGEAGRFDFSAVADTTLVVCERALAEKRA